MNTENILKRLTKLDTEFYTEFLHKYDTAKSDYAKALVVLDFGDILSKLYVNGYTRNDEILYDFIIHNIPDSVLFELLEIKQKR